MSAPKPDARRFVILDRDGTLNVERQYLADPEELELLPGVIEGLRYLRDLGLGLVVVTNQSGVARGYFDSERVDQVHWRLKRLLQGYGISLDALYFCPHAPGDGCSCRKPATGLVEQAAGELSFDPAHCFVIGDQLADVQLGKALGAVTFLVTTGYGAQTRANPEANADFVVDSLVQAARLIETLLPSHSRHPQPEPLRMENSMQTDQSVSRIQAYLLESADIQRATAEACAPDIARAAALIVASLAGGGKLLLCGNGGSAADCQHMAAELVGHLARDVGRPGMAAVALTTNSSLLTAHCNDVGFDTLFARQVETLGKPGDVLIAISTSGNSENVIQAARVARAAGIRVVTLTGPAGALAALADVSIRIPGASTQHIQEAHLAVEHLLCHLVEQTLYPAEPGGR